ncbi:sensor histidine kinase [Sphingomonas sp. GB1N7]|uniref:sensor histidine kinase n=1 Tax=Parasphingomonas caseinilytica TaxID=3096158 RepID=UPI002FC838DA
MSRRLVFSRITGLFVILALCASVAWIVGRIVEQRGRQALALSVLADARLRQALLASEIARFRLLPLALADDRDLIAALDDAPGATRTLDVKLETLAARTGAAAIYVIGRGGRTVSASNWRAPRSFVGQDYRFRRYYIDAVRTGAGEQFALGTVSRKPGLYLTRRTAAGGVVVLKLEFDRLESDWRAAGGITFVTDRAGIVLVTSRPEWRFVETLPIASSVAAAARADSGAPTLRHSPIAALGDGRIRAAGIAETLMLAGTAPDANGWRVQLAMPAGRAIDAVVRLAQVLALLSTMTLAALLWAMRQSARRRAERTSALEHAVSARTADLTREIEERTAAEARAAELREGLRQANRLATLGQITASVAHETAQPVAAIRNYAATGEQWLDRGDLDAVRDNLQAIGRLTGRIGDVTAELRGFSRKGSGPIGPLRLADVVDGARLILKERLSRVTLSLPDMSSDPNVIGGRVRLEQVLVNILQNAIEATEGCPDPSIAMSLEIAADTVQLVVRDNGPGVAPAIALQLFTPFVTSRPTGLGLGLVIAHDIMNDLGGALRLVSTPTGACFVIEMQAAP